MAAHVSPQEASIATITGTFIASRGVSALAQRAILKTSWPPVGRDLAVQRPQPPVHFGALEHAGVVSNLIYRPSLDRNGAYLRVGYGGVDGRCEALGLDDEVRTGVEGRDLGPQRRRDA